VAKFIVLNNRAVDCTFVGYDKASGKYHIHEQLYPEARGFLVHEFNHEKEAIEWLQTLSTEQSLES
jgi:hypothetical protein